MQGPLVRSIIVGALVWLVVCIAGGYVVLVRLGDYGSVLQLLIGLAMGFSGAASHVLLSFFPRYRRLGILRRGLLNWLAAYGSLVAYAALLVNFRMARFNPDFWPDLARLLLLYVGAPMLCLALLVSLVTSTRAGRAAS